MKIAVADNQHLKFDHAIVEYWKTKHEVEYEPGASENLFQWCDLYYVNYWDNNIHYLWKWHKKNPKVKKPKMICRAIDWDVWTGLARGQQLIDWVDETICIAPHIERKLKAEATFNNLHLIRPGIHLDRWPLRKARPGYKIIMPVNEFDWYLKHTIEGLKIFKSLITIDNRPWRLVIKGKWCQAEFFQALLKHYVEIADLKDKVVFDDIWADDMNAYFEQFDYMLLPSLKEAFSFVTAQCAAKGIKPILNWWYGAEEIWPKEWLYQTEMEGMRMFLVPPKPKEYRQVVKERYDVQRMFKEYDKVCQT